MIKSTFTDFESLIANGIVSDYYHALRHYNCYIKINTDIENLKCQSKHSEEFYSYLQNSSLQLCVLHLSKIFDISADRKDSRTRSLPAIIKEINSENRIVSSKRSYDIKWNKFTTKFAPTIVNHPNLNTTNYVLFLTTFSDLLSALLKDNGPLARLLLLRNKHLAHNTSFSEYITLTNEDIATLINFTELFIDYINDFVLTENFFSIPLISTKFLDSL